MIKKTISNLVRRILYGKKVISRKNYLEWLRNIGVRYGSNLYIVDPMSLELDFTRPWLIQLGDNVTITDHVRILTHDFSYSVVARKNIGEIYPLLGKVNIGNNVFIGSHAMIIGGTAIGDNCIIGAGSVVTKDIPSNSVVAGVPARYICSLEDYRKKIEKKAFTNLNIMFSEYVDTYGRNPAENEFTEFYMYYMTPDEIQNKYPQMYDRFYLSKANYKKKFDDFEQMQKFLMNNKEKKDES